MTLLWLYIALSISVSFLCSILEAVALSLTPSYMYSLKKSNPVIFAKLSPLLSNIERPLGAILSLNTVAHTIGAAGAGAQAQKIFGNEFLTLFSILLTLGILVLSEILPKSIGARYWKNLTSFAAFILPPMITLTLPLVWLSEKLSSLIKGDSTEVISRNELDAMADLALSHGSLEKNEHLFLKRLMKFRDIQAASIMTPFEKVFCLPLSTTVDEAFKLEPNKPYSRIPVFGVGQDDIKGYVLKNRILRAKANDTNPTLAELYQPMLLVLENTEVRQLMFRLIERREHIAGVINEEGQFVGIITLEDIIENLLGIAIEDEREKLTKKKK